MGRVMQNLRLEIAIMFMALSPEPWTIVEQGLTRRVKIADWRQGKEWSSRSGTILPDASKRQCLRCRRMANVGKEHCGYHDRSR